MRRPLFAFLFILAPTACRHDLTLCRSEDDGPACVDSGESGETSSSDATDDDSRAPVDANDDSNSPPVDSSTEDSLSAADTLSVEDSTADDVFAEDAADSSAVDSSLPDTASPDTTTADTSKPDTYVADTTVVDTYVADTTVAETSKPDTYVADTTVVDTYVADTYVADTYKPDTYVPDTYVADTYVADTYVADTAPSCTAGSYSCGGSGGNDLLRCGDAGFSLVVTCPAGTCSAALGRCTACTPGAFSCSGTSRKQCDALGATQTLVATCVSAELCAASTGATCAAPVCSAGYKACGTPSPWTLRTCNPGQTAFVDTDCVVDCLPTGGECLTVSSLVGGSQGFCALLSDGTVRCGTDTFAKIPDISTAVQISVGGDLVGARMADGTVRVWTWASGGSGGGPAYAPGSSVPVAGITGSDWLATGYAHACVRLTGGAVKCWGGNSNGALGNGSTSDLFPPSFGTPAVTATGPIAVGNETSFAVTASGTLSWGYNAAGQLGVGSTTNKLVPTSSTFGSVVGIAAGDIHTCGLSSTGTIKCAGANGAGQLGDGSTADHSAPAAVLGLDGQVAQVVAAGQHTCALLKDSTVRCWGMNFSGELGDGTKTDRTYPVVVTGLTGVKQLAAAEGRTCALLNDSMTLKCWGAGIMTPTIKPWH